MPQDAHAALLSLVQSLAQSLTEVHLECIALLGLQGGSMTLLIKNPPSSCSSLGPSSGFGGARPKQQLFGLILLGGRSSFGTHHSLREASVREAGPSP
jgi:hypothetical protein